MKNTLEYAKELVSQMTLEEKMSQMMYQSPAIERLHIPAYNWWNESLHGVARAGVATMFPQAIGLAATFDTEFVHDIADTISTEGRAKYGAYSKRGDRGIYKGITYWAPNINIFRDPRWGRGHETFGEDPYLTAELGISYIKGLQGEDREHLKTTACAKHFAVHSGPEADRHSFDAVADKHDMEDTYLYAFERCVKEGKVEAVMGAYNRVNGEPACGSKTLLKDILRDKWGFEGHVVSDCWAILDFHENHHVTKTVEESVGLAVKNGCDLNCGSAFLHMPRAYEQGLVTEEEIDQAVIRLLDTRIRLGMLEEYPSPYDDIPYSVVECKEHVEQSLEATRRSTVLLKNNGILPLKKENLKTIAVVGPNANSRDALIGNYVGTSSEYITILEGIQRYVGDDIRVTYAEGVHLFKDKVEPLGEENDRLVEAVVTAEEADVVVVCLGLDATIEGEQGDTGNAYASGDKLDLNFPGNQEQLLQAVKATGKPVILVVTAGSAIAVNWANDNVDAIMHAWYPGARGGKAIAELLFGEVSPSGKLPLTFYQSTDDLPDFKDYAMKNRTYRYYTGTPLYPFGYGLSYSKITYKDSKVSATELEQGQSLTLQTTVCNEGAYAVNESTQVYVKVPSEVAMGQNCQLQGVAATFLQPGEKKTIEITLDASAFSHVDQEGNRLVTPGAYVVTVGGQQPDKRSEELLGRKVDSFNILIK